MVQVVEVAEERRRPVEPAVAAEEATVGEGAAPGFANEGGADEVRGLVRRDAEEDLLDGILHQRRQRARAAARHVDLSLVVLGRSAGWLRDWVSFWLWPSRLSRGRASDVWGQNNQPDRNGK